MSYGLKWTLEFENVEETADYKIELLKLDYEDADGTIDTYPNGEALEFVNRGSRSNIDDVIFGTEFIVRFVLTKSELATYDDLFYCRYKEWQCKIYKDETLINVGYIRPENFGIEWMGPTYTASVSFTDGLNDLKQVEYKARNPVLGVFVWVDKCSLLTAIKRALEWTDIDLPFKVQLNTYETTLMEVDECALDLIWIDNKRWQSINNGQYVYANCHKVISDIMRLFNCVLRQANGHYEIINYQEYNSYVYLFDWSTLTEQSRTARNLATDWDAGKFTERGQISKTTPVKYVDLVVRNFSSPSNELTNPDFSAETGSPVTGWNNGPTAGDFDFNQLFVNAFNRLQASDAIIYDAQKTHYFESDPFTLSNTTNLDTLQVTLEMQPSVTMQTAGMQFPLWYLALVRPNGSVFEDVKQNTTNGVQINQRTLPVTGGDGAYKLRFYVQPITDTTVTGYSYYFDSITAIHLRQEGPISLDYKVRLTNNTDGFDTKQLDIVFTDTDQTSDLGGLRNESEELTSEWNRYGKTDELKISVIRGLQLLNDLSRYKNYIRTTIFDPSDVISPHLVLDIDNRVYRFIGYEKNAHKRTIKAELIEIENTDASYSSTEIPLQSQDGSNTGGSSGTDNTGTPGSGDITNVTNVTNITNNYYTIAENPIELVKLQYEGSISSGVVDVIPAPGAGKAIQVLDVIVLGNTTSPTEPDAYLRYADSTENICVIPMSATAVLYYEIKPSAYDLKLNKAIQLATDDFVTSGTGGMQFQIYYRLIDWSGFEEL